MRLTRHLLTHVPRQPLRSDLRSFCSLHRHGATPPSWHLRKKRPGATPAAPLRPPVSLLSPHSHPRHDLRTVYTRGVPNVRSSPRVHGPGVGRPPRLSPGRFGLHGGPVRDARPRRRARHLNTVSPVLAHRRSPRPSGAPPPLPLPRVAVRPFRTPLWTPYAHPFGTPCSMASSRPQPKSREPSIQHGYPSHALPRNGLRTLCSLPMHDATPSSRHLRKKRPGAAPTAPLRPSGSP